MADLDWRGELVAASIEKRATTAARAAGEKLRDESVQRAPIETGTLRASAKTTVEDKEAVVSFNTKYAARQHEEVGWHHNEGQSKYLESTLLDYQEELAQIMAEEIGKAL